jgi:hypothetical protein
MTKKMLLASSITMILLGCGKAEQKDIDTLISRSLIKFTESSGVECIFIQTGGISCNWDKYNKLIEECQHEHYQKYPNIPDIEGRCEEVVKNND